MGIVRYYDSDLGQWSQYSSEGPSWLNTLDPLSLEMGLWISVIGGENVYLDLYGEEITSASVELRKGWNLVGNPSLIKSRTVSEALAGISWTMVQVCDTSRPYDLRYVSGSEMISPGMGMWVHVSEDCTWYP